MRFFPPIPGSPFDQSFLPMFDLFMGGGPLRRPTDYFSIRVGRRKMGRHGGLMLTRSRILVTSARPRPRVRALACCGRGSLPARIEMKMTLSIPRRISRKVNVTRLAHTFGSATQLIHSMQRAANYPGSPVLSISSLRLGKAHPFPGRHTHSFSSLS
jgi:hypothetical protein